MTTTQTHTPTPWPRIIEAAKQHLKWIRDTYPSAHSTAWHAAANLLEADIVKAENACNAHDELVGYIRTIVGWSEASGLQVLPHNLESRGRNILNKFDGEV